MRDTLSTLAGKLRPQWLRDIDAHVAGGQIHMSGGGAMSAHTLNGPYHTGTLDEDQAPWATTDTEFAAHTGDTSLHHARLHNITDAADHSVTGSVNQIVGVSATNTVGLLTPSNDPANAKILISDANGKLTLKGLSLGTAPAIYLSGADDVTAGPDIAFGTNGLIAAQTSIYLAIDSNNDSTSAAVIIGNNAATSGFNELARLTEAGRLGILNNAPDYELDVTGSARLTGSVLVGVTPAITLSGANNVGAGPDIDFNANGLIAAQDSIYLNIDSNNSGTNAALYIKNNAATSAATTLFTFDEDGAATITGKVRTPSIDTVSGNLTIAPAADLVLSPGGSDAIIDQTAAFRADNYLKTFPMAGFRIGPTSVSGQTGVEAGSGEFDELRARLFVADETRVDRGQEYITKSYGILSRSFACPAGAGVAGSIYFENSPHIVGAIFNTAVTAATGDWVMMRYLDMSSGITLTTAWGQVYDYDTVGLTGEQKWTFVFRSGTGGLTFGKGAMAVDMGVYTGGQYILSDAVTATAPFIQIGKWVTNPYTPANYSVLGHFGRLDGVGFTGELGLAVSKDNFTDAGTWLKVGTTDARFNNIPITLWSGGQQKINLDANGTDVWFGSGSTDKRLAWDGTTLSLKGSLSMYNGATLTGYWAGTGNSLWLGPGTADRRLEWTGTELNIDGRLYVRDASRLDGAVTLGASGGIYQGTGTFASPTTGLKIWRDSSIGRIGGYNGGALQWYANTDGKLYAGAGAVVMDANGMTLEVSLATHTLKFEDVNGQIGKIDGFDDLDRHLYIRSGTHASRLNEVMLIATAGTTPTATLAVKSTGVVAITATNLTMNTYEVWHAGTLVNPALTDAANVFTQKQTINFGSGVPLKPGASSDHVYMEFYARSATPTTRSAYVGYSAAASTNFRIVNQITDGHISLTTAGTGNVGIRATTPAYDLDVNGNVRIVSGQIYSANTVSLLHTSGAAQAVMTANLLTSDDYAADAANVPSNGIYSKGDIVTAGGLGVIGAAGFTNAIYVKEIGSTPTNPSGDNQLLMYVRGDKLVLAFLQTGTMNYFYFSLKNTNSPATWVYNGSTPPT